ncbi:MULTISPECIES: hypothetical protein [unclassified Arthrobacter]|uniref:hypothetical protein n=1 Tax=unclassified Arthrobacter TaxID=235627 RepID=UPI002DFA293C|nr:MULTISPECIES: hypothetical protein [unclassified Arthrobacter]MEC5191658.1 hypothetical protein [Arthrobacter sp. MP_M4]MEC5203349.1 hypothetical protein [Arthrobacter sp. MP_M7]
MIGNILRFKTAVAVLLLGLLTLLAGIGQKTFWAPPETVTASAPAGTDAPLTVFDGKLRTLHDGTVTINVKGEGSFMLAAGRPDDVQAWVGNTAHNTVSGVSEDSKALQVTRTDGDATAPSPAGSDLWVTTEDANGELKYNWTPPADGDWSLLLAADGTKPAPSSISMTFPNDTSTPWAIPLMVLGGLLILVGAALLAFKPKGGKRAGRGGKTAAAARTAPVAGAAADEPKNTIEQLAAAPVSAAKRRRRTGAVAAVLTATALAGSGVAAQASQTPTPSPSTSSAAAGQGPASPVLVDAQVRRILEQVASAVDAGDAAKDAGKLASRVAGTEINVRTQNYRIRSQVGSYEARMPVRATKLLTTVIPDNRSWPRTVLAVTQGEGNVVPQLLTLTQTAPRENYKLVLATPLQPGTTFPEITRGGTGTLAPSDKTGLLYSGEEALAGLGDRLKSADSAFKDKLAEGASSPYIADTLAYQTDVVNSGVNGTFSFAHTIGPDSLVVFRTADGGALALGRLDFGFDGTPKAAGDKLTIGDDAAALAGGKETSTGMVLNFAESVAVYIPPAGSQDPMKLVAATRGLVGANFK